MHNNLSSPNHLDVDDVLVLAAEEQSRRKSQLSLNLISGTNTNNNNNNNNSYTNRAIMSFVDAVGKMNEEVLVPSRLRDIEVRENDADELMPQNSDLYSFYQMLNTVKKDLFSSSLFYKTFKPNISATNSGQNSGRVTPTQSMSRRSSYSVGSSNINGTASIINGTLNNNGTQISTNGTKISPTLLSPPSQLDRKLSSPCPMIHSSFDQDQTMTMMTPDRSDVLSPSTLLPSLSLSYVSRATSLSSLLSSFPNANKYDNCYDNGELTQDERVEQITGCFMYHLSALYTIMGHFTKTAKYITKRYQEEMNNL